MVFGVWLVSAAQRHHQGGGGDQEEGGDGGADADEQACGGGPARLGPVSRCGGRGGVGVASSEAVGVEGVKGLMGRVMSTKGPLVPTS